MFFFLFFWRDKTPKMSSGTLMLLCTKEDTRLPALAVPEGSDEDYERRRTCRGNLGLQCCCVYVA